MIHLTDNPKFKVGDRVSTTSKHLGHLAGEVIHIRETSGQYYLTVQLDSGTRIGGNQNQFDKEASDAS